MSFPLAYIPFATVYTPPHYHKPLRKQANMKLTTAHLIAISSGVTTTLSQSVITRYINTAICSISNSDLFPSGASPPAGVNATAGGGSTVPSGANPTNPSASNTGFVKITLDFLSIQADILDLARHLAPQTSHSHS